MSKQYQTQKHKIYAEGYKTAIEQAIRIVEGEKDTWLNVPEVDLSLGQIIKKLKEVVV